MVQRSEDLSTKIYAPAANVLRVEAAVVAAL